MNYASKIINYLAAEDRVTRVILVAGAPPIEKRGRELRVVVEAILNPDDVRDTLASLASHVNHSGTATLGDHGVFSFGIPTLGRFRVHHLTQRGSDMVCIQRMPFAIPDLAGSLADPTQIGEIDRVVGTCEPGIILVTGPSSTALARFIYGALARVNAQANRVLYIAEQNLSFILKHQKSIVIQVEVGTDCPTLALALGSALSLAPDILYARDLRLPIDFSAVMRAVDAGTRVLVSEAALSPRDLLAEWQRRVPADYDGLHSLIRTILSVTDDNAGLLRVQHNTLEHPTAASPPTRTTP
jgi:twitching motility protein PilT